MPEHITTRPVSHAPACQCPGERCSPGHSIWVSTHLSSQPMHSTAGMAYNAYENGNLLEMKKFQQVLWSYARADDDTGWQLTAQNLLGLLQLAEGQIEDAYNTFVQTARWANSKQHGPYFRAQLQEAMYGWALAAHDLNLAQEFEQAIDQFDSLVGACGCVCADDMRTLMLSGLRHLKLGRPVLAAAVFQELISRYQYVSPFYRFVATFGIAESALANNDVASAQTQLESINDLIEHGQGHGAILAWLPRFPYTYALAQRLFTEWRFVASGAQEIVQVPLAQRAQADLRIYAFGNGHVIWQGQTVDFSHLRHGMALLTYLALHPQGARGEQLRFTLWPQVHTDQQLMVALREVRSMLGQHTIVCRNSVYSIHPQIAFWLDVAAFQDMYHRALKLPLVGRRDALMLCVSLYRGPFLQMSNMTWADDMRRRLLDMMASAWWQVAEWASTQGDVEQSIASLEKVLEIDPLYERGVAALMRQLDSIGQSASAMRLYLVHQKRVRKTLGIEPSPQLQKLAERLRQEQREPLTAAFQTQDLVTALHRQTGSPMAQFGPPAAQSGSRFMVEATLTPEAEEEESGEDVVMKDDTSWLR